jgi:Pseudouridylate synthases, 23S RNA-specific
MAFLLDESLLPRIVYEDERLIAVHKPPRMHSAPGQGSGDLCSWAFERYPEVARVRGRGSGQSQAEGGLLHRLDFETSGLVLFARDGEAFARLLEAQAAGAFRKEYAALCSAPLVEEPQGSRPRRGSPFGIDSVAWARARDEGGYAESDASAMAALLGGACSGGRVGVECAFRPFGPKGGRVACLGEEAVSSDAAKDSARPLYRSAILSCAALPFEGPAADRFGIRVSLERGFRHQIRAQLAWIGLPICGDPLYGGRGDERLRLYAVALSFAHPASGESLRISFEG